MKKILICSTLLISLFTAAGCTTANPVSPVSRRAPNYAQPILKFDSEQIKPGAKVEATLTIKAFQNVTLSQPPTIRLWKPGNQQNNPPDQEIPVQELSHLTLKAGEEKVQKVEWTAPKEPGHYTVVANAYLQADGSSTVGSYSSLFVQYPEGGVLEKTLNVEKSTTVDGHTLTVHEVTLTKEHTALKFTFSPAPFRADYRLLVDDQVVGDTTGGGDLGVGGDFDYKGPINLEPGYYEPTPLTAKKLTLEVYNFQTLNTETHIVKTEPIGPWRVEIAL